MFRAQYAQDMKKINIQTIIAICFVLLLIFYLLNIVVLFSLLRISRIITTSYTKISKTNQDRFTSTYLQEKPWKQAWESPEPSWSFSCETAHFEYDLCYLNRRAMVDPMNATVSIIDPTGSTPPSTAWLRPYPRKGHVDAMRKAKEVKLTTDTINKPCTVEHDMPVLIFSTGGFTGNTFHDFNEGWFPLFVTINEFFKDRDVIFGIYDCKDWWLERYAELIPLFTRYPIINLDKEKRVHCFPSGIVGLKLHGIMEVDPNFFKTNRKTMLDFHSLLGEAFKHGHQNEGNILPSFSSVVRPRLAFMVRRDTRNIINEEDVIRLVEDVGFEVIVFEITKKTPLREIYRLIHSSHAFMGIHGAGLTHLLFLRPGAVFVQIIPINMGWLADMCYSKTALRLGIEHVAYEINFDESSLKTDDFAQKAHLDRLNPASSMMGGLMFWNKYMDQDIDVDLIRFKRYIEKAYVKARNFMQKERLYVDS